MGDLGKCPFGCPDCQRRCTAAMSLSHRFDCCGQIAAHDVVMSAGKKREPFWRRFSDPMRSGYLTGPSKTKAAS